MTESLIGSRSSRPKLAANWAWSTLGEVTQLINGFAFKPSDWGARGLPIVRIQNLTDPTKNFNFSTRQIDPRLHINFGDILVSWSATLDVFYWRAGHALLNQHIFRAVPYSSMSRIFTFYLLKYSIEELKISEHIHGSTMRHVNRGPFLAHSVPIPPKAEQQRIADKLDQLFSQIEKGEENLRRVEALVERYRQSVLKAAVTGELTREWRQANSGKGETGEQLLQRILKARRETWEAAELAKLKARGKSPKNDSWKQKYKEPEPPDTSDLPELPEGWIWASLDQLVVGELTNGLSIRGSDTPPGVPALKLDALSEHGLDTSRRRYLQVSETRAKALSIRKGDLLISRANGSLRLLARARLVGEIRETIIFPDTIIRARLPVFGDLADLVVAIWESPLLRDQIAAKAKTSAGIWKVSQSDLRGLVLPLPGEDECGAICASLDKHVARADLASASCEQEIGRVKGLRQSILRDAFSGRLVPQDPKDEPANVLLERIAAERAAQDAERPKRGRRTKSKEAAE